MGSDDALKGLPSSGLKTIDKGHNLWIRSPHGVAILCPLNYVNYEYHAAYLPEAVGIADQISKQIIAFVFENTNIKRLTATIPEYNHLTRRLAEKCGFEFIGINRKSFMKDDVLHDQFIYGISKG